MYIESLKIVNFKSFIDEEIRFKIPNGENGSGINVFVGENNCGKSNLFEALDFLRNGTKKNIESLKNNTTRGDFYVEATFSGDISAVINSLDEEKDREKLAKLIIKNDNKEYLKIKRQSNEVKVQQGKKEVKIDVSKISVFNSESNQYENQTGIPGLLISIFDFNFLWADTNPNDETAYSSTSLSGKLLSEITKNFQKENETLCNNFLASFKKTFNDADSGLQMEFDKVAKETESIIKKQFKEIKIAFKIDEPKFEDFFKKMKIDVDDGTTTLMSEKGNGLQRAICLSLIQVYAKQASNGVRPFFLFIDEPEISYHPQAQRKLLSAFLEIGKSQQIFINTHSPYLISPSHIENSFRIFMDSAQGTKVISMTENFTAKEKEIHSVEIREIFFANEIICFEGTMDIYRMSAHIPNFDSKTLIKMNGCGNLSKFWKVLNAFKYNFKILLDIDVIHNNVMHFKNFNEEIHQMVIDLDIEHTKSPNGKKTASSFFDNNLSEEKKIKKYAIINKLKEMNIFLLPNGMLEDYFDQNGNITSNERENEIKAIFPI